MVEARDGGCPGLAAGISITVIVGQNFLTR
jgi:hypothetical protein